MAERRPLVVIDGQVQELPSGDTTPSSGGGSTTFTGLTDTPGALGTSGQIPAVNGAGDALEWIDAPTDGQDGDPGADGADGQGVPVGGSTGQILAKIDGTDYNTEWINAPSNSMTQTEITATSYTAVSADFAGNIVRLMNNASAQTITVNSGLTAPEPLTVVQIGAGTVSFAAGASVTIYSLDSNLDIAGQYGSATLIPIDTDTYVLVGALA